MTTYQPVRYAVLFALEEDRPRSAGDGRAGAFFVGDRLPHSNKSRLYFQKFEKRQTA
jgi:hypothetical protein